jgi:hypothetical protein
MGPAALSFYVCLSLKPSSRPRLYDDYRYAIPYNRYAADQFVMVHKNNTFRKNMAIHTTKKWFCQDDFLSPRGHSSVSS